ncbi:MAG: ATP-binding protein [Reyranellaceae bacterium]
MSRRGPERAAPTTALPLRLIAADKAASNSLPKDGAASLLAAAFETCPDCLAVVDSEGRLLQINPAGQAMLPAAVPGRNFCDALAPQARLALTAALAQALAGQPGRMECQALEGGPLLELTVSALSGAGSRHALVSGRDIERLRGILERARQAERHEALARLAGGLAHDFNNILTVIMGNGELLAELLAEHEEGRALAQVSLAAARAGADLTRLLLNSTGPQAQRPSEFCVADCLQELRGLIERSLGPAIALEIAADADPWSVRADRAQLASVLLNLALNARDAMPGGGRLAIDARNLDEQNCVMIAVSDTGSGMPAALLERVFEPFFTTKETGTGLGLPMVQEFARRAGGRIAIASSPGAGTTVRLYLPRVELQLGLPHLDGGDDVPRAREGEAVLVLEHDGGVQALLMHQLRALGYAVAAAQGEQAALDAMRALERVDLLVAGAVSVPGDEARLIRKIRKLQPQVQILFVSAEPGAESTRSLRARTGGGVLSKPFTRTDLARRVRAALDGRL